MAKPKNEQDIEDRLIDLCNNIRSTVDRCDHGGCLSDSERKSLASWLSEYDTLKDWRSELRSDRVRRSGKVF